ncbi:hypothetical protein VNO80_26182 [Phaseolus coccineus]|uniref:Uncharacterized protein n=1 Tax=Phaseolus coccineus TaxID=3886 RepID=A0AAN9LEA1_PHACN
MLERVKNVVLFGGQVVGYIVFCKANSLFLACTWCTCYCKDIINSLGPQESPIFLKNNFLDSPKGGIFL